MNLEDIELAKIDFMDDRFRISYFFDLERLRRSIDASGLLNPVVVTYRKKCLVIVMGWKRALACRDLSQSALSCYILEEPHDLKAFQLAVLENISMRDFNILELAVILKKLNAFGLEEKRLLETYLPLFGIPRTLAHLDAYLTMAEFDDKTKEFIHVKKTSYPVIQLLMELDERERAALLPHLRHLGQNKQMELLEFLIEISKRDNIPVLEILASEVIANVIKSVALSASKRADKIRLLLRERRYPKYSAQENSFQTSLKKLEWPEDIVIDHSPFFEGEELSVSLTFRDSAEFKEKITKLQKIASANQISELLKSISND